MKRILPTVAAGSFLIFVILLFAADAADAAFHMHIGEPSYYSTVRIDFLIAAVICFFASFVSTLAMCCRLHGGRKE